MARAAQPPKVETTAHSSSSLSGLGGAGASSSEARSRTSPSCSARIRFASVRSAAVCEPVS